MKGLGFGWMQLRAPLPMLVAGAVICANISAAGAGSANLVLDAKSGEILTSNNADVRNHPASLTKMMTLYLTFEALHQGKLSWNTKIPFSRNAASKPPTKLGVRRGFSITVREAVLGMIVKSANDAAAAMSEKLGGSEPEFARMMTAKARKLGMSQTIFTNASGLPSRAQVTTARDMSTLAVALMNDFPKEYRLFATESFTFRGRTIHGHNNLVYRHDGIDGIKTGYTNASGFNVVSAIKKGNRRVIGVVMGGRTARSRDTTMATLLDRYVPEATNSRSSILVASVATKRTMVAAVDDPFDNPPVPAAAPRQNSANRQIASSSDMIADLITASTIAKTGDATPAGWQIQIAAANSEEAAMAMLTKVGDRFSDTLASATPYTEAVKQGSNTLYRARFTGFESRQAAAAACEVLEQQRMSCLAVGARG